MTVLLLSTVWMGCASKPVKEPPSSEEQGKVVSVTPPSPLKLGKFEGLSSVYFEFDQYGLTPQAREQLRSHAEWLKQHALVKVQVEGHCDNRGSDQYNLALGEKRSQSVVQFLVDLGIPKNRLSTLSYGEMKPVDMREAEGAWARNRRAEFVIISLE